MNLVDTQIAEANECAIENGFFYRSDFFHVDEKCSSTVYFVLRIFAVYVSLHDVLSKYSRILFAGSRVFSSTEAFCNRGAHETKKRLRNLQKKNLCMLCCTGCKKQHLVTTFTVMWCPGCGGFGPDCWHAI
jgi:hypothetical protein